MAVTTQQLWNLSKEFIKDSGLVRQHIDSYDDFVDRGLQAIVDEVGELPIEIGDYPLRIKLGKLEIGAPRVIEVDGTERSIYPAEARIRNLTYAAPLHMEMIPVIGEREGQPEMVYIGDLPVMLKSKICLLSKLSSDDLVGVGEDPLDPGGYFIVNGSERVIVALEDLAANRILVDIEHTGVNPTYKAKIFSTTVGFRARIEVTLKADGGTYATMPGIPSDIPFMILMRALGFEEDAKVAELVSLDPPVQNELEGSFEKSLEATNSRDALLYLGNRLAPGQVDEYRLRKAESVLDRNFLPHMGRVPADRREKGLFLTEIATRIIEVKLQRRNPDDKDHYANKRLKLAGSLLAELFRISFRNLTRDLKYQLERITIRRHIEFSIANAIRPGIITERVQHAIATRNWLRGRIGVTQLLDRTNFVSTLSHLRRLQSPLSRSQPNLEARDLHPTHYGRLCPDETPEGSNCGLVKNLALSSSISVGVEPREMVDKLRRMGVVLIEESDKKLRATGGKAIVDGILAGYSKDPEALAGELRELRREGKLSSEVNVSFHPPEGQGGRPDLHVNCDAGRVRRPVIIVEGGRPRLTEDHLIQLEQGRITWQDLVRSGVVEMLDADEEENAFIAMYEHDLKKDHTHLEIAPYVMLGIAASMIPFPEHNQSPRNAYESAMAKQALGVFSTNFFTRVDSRSHLLHYPQTPIVQTKPMEVFNALERPSGQNVVVAILSFQGYNMEDAIIINKSSVDRGLFRSTFYRIYEAESRQYLGGLRDKFEIPEAGIRGYRGDRYYRLIEEDGIISPEAEATGNTVLVGRTSPPRFMEEYREFEAKGPTKRDSSVTMRPSEQGTIDQVFVTESIEGSKLVKVKVRDLRIPELGDKFASRHGQKGVIGLIAPQEDLPFTGQGIIPDLIINPHAIPSRMTVAHVLEQIGGKVGSLEGRFIDGTPFSGEREEAMRKALEENGFRSNGKEILYDGRTGRMIPAEIFVGVIYYQKLHHMVSGKLHVRSRGPVQILTRQPTEGRSRQGGLRFGEMERDCLIGHGAAMVIKDRLLDESDGTIQYVCGNQDCGHFAIKDRKGNLRCPVCENTSKIYPVQTSYAFKLLLDELLSLGVVMRLQLEDMR